MNPHNVGSPSNLLHQSTTQASAISAPRDAVIYRPKQQAAAPGEDFDEAEEYGEDYGGGEYDDLPPWDEEEEEGGE